MCFKCNDRDRMRNQGNLQPQPAQNSGLLFLPLLVLWQRLCLSNRLLCCLRCALFFITANMVWNLRCQPARGLQLCCPSLYCQSSSKSDSALLFHPLREGDHPRGVLGSPGPWASVVDIYWLWYGNCGAIALVRPYGRRVPASSQTRPCQNS